MKSIISVLSAVAAIMIFSSMATANPYTVDSGWQSFVFGPVGSQGSPTLEFTLSGSGKLSVTDAYATGDQFRITNFAAVIGDTTAPTSDPVNISDPYLAFSSPSFSHGVFDLGPGSYSIGEDTLLSPWRGGGAFWRVDTATNPVPEPGTVALLGAGFIGLAVYTKRRKNG